MTKPSNLGFGTMSLTWTPKPQPVEDSVATIAYVVEKYRVKNLNGGVFYGADLANLKLLKAFFDYSAKNLKIDTGDLVVSIKGLISGSTFAPDGSKENVDAEIKLIQQFFPPKGDKNRPKILFEPARVDKKIPFNETISYIHAHVENGDIDGISLSEVSLESIALAAKTAPIAAIEVEVSFLSLDVFQNGVLKEASKHQIPIFAYSPLARGLLTDKAALEADSFLEGIPEGDFRLTFDRFQKDNYGKNMALIKKLSEFAKKKGISLEALALSWTLSLKGKSVGGIDNITAVVPIPSGSTQQKIDANFGSIIDLTVEEVETLYELSSKFEVSGGRYNEHAEASLFG